jgi:class I lanthipeptide synthase
MPWRNLLEGELRERALDTIRDVVGALGQQDEKHGATVAGGNAGMALMYAYLAQAGLGDFEPAEEALTRAVDAVAEQPMRPDLYGGFTGVAWAAEHLQGGPPAEGETESDDGAAGEDANEAIDEALIDHLQHSPWRGDYDLIIGLVGYAVYALERVHRESARRILALIVDRLDEIAVPMAKGISWLTPPVLMIPETAKLNPEGYYNAGLAHGVPGVIAVAAAIAEAGVAVEKAGRLATGAVDWMLSLRHSAPDGSEFPYAIPKHSMDGGQGCRAAWCYGDPGIAVSLLWAARAARRRDWEQVALEVGKQTATRAMDRCGVVDAGLCHGATGLAHIYNRMWQASGDEAFRDAAERWYRRVFELREPGKGIGGYLTWGPAGADYKLGWIEDAGLLTGVSGVVLALLAGASDVEPRWDRMLLTAVPPR